MDTGVNQDEQVNIETLRSMARTVAHDLNQPLAILQAKIQMSSQLGLIPLKEDWAVMQAAVSQIAEKIRHYQRLTAYQEIQDNSGFTFLYIENL